MTVAGGHPAILGAETFADGDDVDRALASRQQAALRKAYRAQYDGGNAFMIVSSYLAVMREREMVGGRAAVEGMAGLRPTKSGFEFLVDGVAPVLGAMAEQAGVLFLDGCETRVRVTVEVLP